MKKFNVNGSSFVVVHDGKVVVNKGYGYADKEKKIPVGTRSFKLLQSRKHLLP